MNISKISNINFNAKIVKFPNANRGKGLTPLSEHKGPILQLTEDEKRIIDTLQDGIDKLQRESMKIIEQLYSPNSCNTYDFLQASLEEKQQAVEMLMEKIKEIKKNRYNEQKKAMKKD